MLKPQIRFATIREGARALPCLWPSRVEARRNCERDERVVKVRILFMDKPKEPRPTQETT